MNIVFSTDLSAMSRGGGPILKTVHGKIVRIQRLPLRAAILVPYRRIPKISPGAYIFQKPYFRGSFLEWHIGGGAYLWSEICVSKSIGLAL